MAGNPAIYENPANWPDIYLCRNLGRQLHINQGESEVCRHCANQRHGLILVGHIRNQADNVHTFGLFLNFRR